MIPGFNPETKTDEELNSILGDLHTKLNLASRISYGTGVIDQLRAMIAIVSATLQERIQATHFSTRLKSQKATVESDPELANAGKPNKPGVRNDATARKPVQRMVVLRSDKPNNQTQIDPTKDT